MLYLLLASGVATVIFIILPLLCSRDICAVSSSCIRSSHIIIFIVLLLLCIMCVSMPSVDKPSLVQRRTLDFWFLKWSIILVRGGRDRHSRVCASLRSLHSFHKSDTSIQSHECYFDERQWGKIQQNCQFDVHYFIIIIDNVISTSSCITYSTRRNCLHHHASLTSLPASLLSSTPSSS